MSCPRVRTRAALLAIALAGSSVLAACSTSSGATAGDTLTIAMASDPTCLDPQQTEQLSATDISRSIVDTLTDQDPKSGTMIPWLASSFSASGDARKFTFTLRPGVTFSDGTPVNSAAVKATFDKLATLPANGAPAYISGYTGTTVANDHELTVNFSAPNAQFLQATSDVGLGIMSIATAAKPLADRCRGQFVGSGPYVLDHYTANQEVVLKRRPGYAWPSSLSTNRGAAPLAQIHYLFVPEAGARSAALSSGQAQVAEDIQPTDQHLFQGNGFHLLTTVEPGVVPPMSLNLRGVLTDQRVRKAISEGIDRVQLVKTVLGPQAKPATSVLASSTPFYVPTNKLRFDPTDAKNLLTQAGWLPGPDGIRVRQGQRLTLDWLIPAPSTTANEFIQQQLKSIGIDLELAVVPPAEYIARQTSGDFDISEVSVTRADPDLLRTLFYSKGPNLWHLPPSELDTYLTQQASATDTATRQTAVTNAVDWLLDQADTVPLYENSLVYGVSDQVTGLRTDASTRLDLQNVRVG